jgi:transcriptional regulator with XRE-family HTH domain
VPQRAGRVFAEARQRAGLSQRQLAGRMGVSQQALSRIEKGGTSITITTLSRLADGLGVNLTVMVGDLSLYLGSGPDVEFRQAREAWRSSRGR